MATVKHVTTTVNGVPHTTTVTVPNSSSSAPAKTPSSNVVSSAPHSDGSWIDPIRAPGDTRPTTGNNVQNDDGSMSLVAAGSDNPTGTKPSSNLPGLNNLPSQVAGNIPAPQTPGATAVAGAAGATPVAPPPSPYQQAFTSLQAGGGAAPQDAGQARAQVLSAKPYAPDTTAVDAYVSQDPGVADLFKNITDLLQPENQTSSLMDDYQKLYKQSSLGDINKELIDAETVINGTEDDIRNEIQTAGGFGTDSQVQAMSLARNKSLLTRYNQLVQMQTNAQNQLNTMTSLDSQDKQMAQTRLNTQISTMFNLANFQQQATNNTREAAQWLVTNAPGSWAGIYAAYKNDPKQMSMLESSLGLAPGGLQENAENYTALQRPAKRDTQVVTLNGQPTLVDTQTGDVISNFGTANTNNSASLNQSQDTINTINTLTSDVSATGPNPLSRWDPFSGFTGRQQNFLAGVQQITQGLTLQNLENAKQNGATFGALSEGELNLLSSSATKINSWAVKDKDGNINGYNTTDANMKAELNKIANYTRLDYINKGGDPTQVGAQLMTDGHYYVQNSDNSFTQIK